MSDRNSSSSLKTVNGMALAKGVGGSWLCGPDTDYANVGELMAYLDSLSPPLTVYNIKTLPGVVETSDYASTNTSLVSCTIEYDTPFDPWDWSAYQVLNFSACPAFTYLSLGTGSLQYTFTASKNGIVFPANFVQFNWESSVYNYSADGLDTPFIDGGNNVYIYTNDFTSIYIDTSSNGGVKNVIWGGTPMQFYGGATTVKNVISSPSLGINTVLSSLIIGGTFADGAGYVNPIIECDKFVVGACNISVTAGITIKGNEGFFGNLACDEGTGYPIFDFQKLKMPPSYTNLGRAQLYDGGMYTFEGVTWEDLDLKSGFDACSLRATGNRFTGTDAGVMGSDYANNTAVTVTTSSTTETTMAQLKTCAYTFTSDGDMLEFFGQFTNALVGGNTATIRIIIGSSTLTISTIVAGNGSIYIKFIRKDSGTLTVIYDYDVSNTFREISNSTDITVSTIDPITISVTAQVNGGSSSVSFFASSWRLFPDTTS